MKTKIVAILFGILLFVACNKADEDDPTPVIPQVETITIESAQLLCNTELAWLKDIIKKAEEDKATKQHKGNYMGSIHLTSYKNEPVFYVFMMINSGWALGHTFTCSGTEIYPDAAIVADFPKKAITEGKLLYKNTP